MKGYADYIDATDMRQRLQEMRQQIERLTAELSAAKAKHYEECAVIAKSCQSGFGAAHFIRAALTDTSTQPLK